MRSPSCTHSRSQPRTRGSPRWMLSSEVGGRSSTPEDEKSATRLLQLVEGTRCRVADAGAVLGAGVVGELVELVAVLLHPVGIGALTGIPVRVQTVHVLVGIVLAVAAPHQRLAFLVSVVLLALALDVAQLLQAVDEDRLVSAVARLELLEGFVGVHPPDLRDPLGRLAAVPRAAR